MEEEELLKRVFRVISVSHFKDYGTGPFYKLLKIEFPRWLGKDLANYVKTNDPVFYNELLMKERRK